MAETTESGATTSHVDFTKPPVAAGDKRESPAPEAPAAPVTLALPIDEYQRLRGAERQLAEFQAQQQKVIEEARQAEYKALADKGEVEQALAKQQADWEAKHLESEKRFKALESQVLSEKYEATISESLTGVEWVGDTPEQRAEAALMFRLRIKADFQAERLADGRIEVRDKASGRPAAEVLRERLSDPKLAFLIAPRSRGGSGGDGTRTPADKEKPAPGSLEAIAAKFKAQQGQYGSIGLHAKS